MASARGSGRQAACGRASFAALVLLALGPLLGGARTVEHYPLANGVGAAAIRLSDGRLDAFRPAIYAALDQGLPTPELAWDAYFALRTASSSRWLTEVGVDEVRAEDDANALVVAQHDAGLAVETRWLAPFGLARPAVLALITVTNPGTTTIEGVSVVSLANFHVGGGDGTTAEHAHYDAARDAIIETGARGTLVARALVPSSGHTMSPDNPWPLVQGGLPIPGLDDSGVRDDVVHGFVFAPPGGAVAPGAQVSFGVVLAFTTGDEEALEDDLDAFIAGRAAAAIVDDELAAARAFVAGVSLPLGLSADERRLAGWSLALLRAAQVRDPVDGGPRRRPGGQLVASLPPGMWNISWARDAAYAVEGLLAVGANAEAARALQFMLRAEVGEYQAYVGRPYLVSVTRYYGGGREESDSNASGPNLEWDDFGLFLHAYARALAAGGTGATELALSLEAVKSGVADVLLALVDPATGLLVPDSSIWETHWTPSGESVGRRQYAYSTACAAAGLRAFAEVLAERGDGAAVAYRGAAQALSAALTDELVDAEGALAASREELAAGGGTLDAAVLEAFNRDVLAPSGPIAVATLATMAGLRASTPGYFRNDEGGEYDRKEWLVVDLWLARAFRRAGDEAEAARLLAHVTRVGVDNLGQIPELLRPGGLGGAGIADGAVPMIGFGAGAYLRALADRALDLGLVEPGEGEGEGEGLGEGEGEGASEGEGEGEGASEGEGEGAGEGEGEGEGEGDAPQENESCANCTAGGAPWALAGLALLARRRGQR